MFIMKKEILDGYSEWLFDLLFTLEKKADLSKYDAFHARLFGRISERLLDVYLNTNGLHYYEVKQIYIGKVNWPKKITSFLMAKFFGRKYDQSF